jgi:hypothetical protein
VKVWFVVRSADTLRFVEPVIVALQRMEHEVVVALDLGRLPPHGLPGVEIALLAGRPAGSTGMGARGTLGALASYAELRGRWVPLLRERWFEYFPRSFGLGVRMLDAARLSFVVDGRLTRRALAALARRWPVSRAIRAQLEEVQPDLVVATPVLYPGSREQDAVAAAKAAGIPTAAMVLSWDNLTSKGTYHVLPDRLIVWNEAQRREAVEWHGFPSDRIVALGAPVFDYLFEEERPARDEVARELGIGPNEPYVVYAVSSRLGMGTGGETELARSFAEELRKLRWDDRTPTVVVRPHPKNAEGIRAALGTVAIVTREAFPDSPRERAWLHGLLAHAAAVVGLNTSLFIESAIVGTPVVAIDPPLGTGNGTAPTALPHYQHLVRGGFMHPAASVETAARVVQEIARVGDARATSRAAFVESFVRPLGLERSAAECVATELARVTSRPPYADAAIGRS